VVIGVPRQDKAMRQGFKMLGAPMWHPRRVPRERTAMRDVVRSQ
jgi:hypothetical protein